MPAPFVRDFVYGTMQNTETVRQLPLYPVAQLSHPLAPACVRKCANLHPSPPVWALGLTELLYAVIGEIQPDAGSAWLSPAGLRIGYLAKALEYQSGQTVDQAMKAAVNAWAYPLLTDAESSVCALFSTTWMYCPGRVFSSAGLLANMVVEWLRSGQTGGSLSAQPVVPVRLSFSYGQGSVGTIVRRGEPGVGSHTQDSLIPRLARLIPHG
jgi:hypothetical protein